VLGLEGGHMRNWPCRRWPRQVSTNLIVALALYCSPLVGPALAQSEAVQNMLIETTWPNRDGRDFMTLGDNGRVRWIHEDQAVPENRSTYFCRRISNLVFYALCPDLEQSRTSPYRLNLPSLPASILLCSVNGYPINNSRYIYGEWDASEFLDYLTGRYFYEIEYEFRNGVYRYRFKFGNATDVFNTAQGALSAPAGHLRYNLTVEWHIDTGLFQVLEHNPGGTTISNGDTYRFPPHDVRSWAMFPTFDELTRQGLVRVGDDIPQNLTTFNYGFQAGVYRWANPTDWNTRVIPCGSGDNEFGSIRLHSPRTALAILSGDATALSQQAFLANAYDANSVTSRVAAPAGNGALNQPSIAVVTIEVADTTADLRLRVDNNSQSGLGQIAPYDPTFAGNGGSTAAWSSEINIPASSFEQAPDGSTVALALLRASGPVEGPVSRIATLTATQGENQQERTFRFTAPPVLLVHGLWSRVDGAWGAMRSAIELQTAAPFIHSINYPNVESFVGDPVQSVFRREGIDAALVEADSRGIVANNVIVIGHSLGGLVTRAHAMGLDATSLYLNPVNLNQGDVAALYTLNTPHAGSPLANDLLSIADDPLSDIDLCDPLVPASVSVPACLWSGFLAAAAPATARDLLDSIGQPLGPAHVDLSEGSVALGVISGTPVPGRGVRLPYTAVATRAPLDGGITDWRPDLLEFGLDVVRLVGGLSTDTDTALGGDGEHDVIVPLVSQLSGATRSQVFAGFTHIANPFPNVSLNAGVPGVVEASIVADFVACDIAQGTNCVPSESLAAADIARPTNDVDLSGRTFEAGVLDLQVLGLNSSGTPTPQLPIRAGVNNFIYVNPNNGTLVEELAFLYTEGDGQMMGTEELLNQRFTLLPSHVGAASVVVLATLNNGTFSTAQASFEISSHETTPAIQVEPGSLYFSQVGDSALVNVVLDPQSAQQVLVNNDVTFSLMSSSNPAVTISDSGLVTAQRNGVATIQAEYVGQTDQIIALVGSTTVADIPGRRVLAATLPNSRSIQTGSTATIFATMLNSGSVDAIGCGVRLFASDTPGTFTFQATDPATNAPIGQPGLRMDIPPGGAQSFVLAFTPDNSFDARQLSLDFDCTNSNPARDFPGANTWTLASSADPIADIIVVSATLSADGFVRIPGASGTGVVATAISNLGVEETITVNGSTGNNDLGLTILVCQTNPATGQCSSARASTLDVVIGAGETPTFAFFVRGEGNIIPSSPANNRLFLNFAVNGELRGSTSVAIVTD
jgi:Alpha/beta hydrolase family